MCSRISGRKTTVRGFFTSRAQSVEPCDFTGVTENNSYINPWDLTGFIDGEGSFTINISKNNNKVGLGKLN